MTDRQRTGGTWESWVDRQIREAQERGEFDDLPGKGKPLPDLDRPRDEMWWVKGLMRREGLSITPETLELRKAREDALERASRARSEAEVRRILAGINGRIRALNSRPASGPPSDVAPIDIEAVVRDWRRRRA